VGCETKHTLLLLAENLCEQECDMYDPYPVQLQSRIISSYILLEVDAARVLEHAPTDRQPAVMSPGPIC